MSDLAGRTILMSGGSRGIGLAIALRAARDGANVVLLAKTDLPHPRLKGTVHSAAAVAQAAQTFGGIDVVVNNASAIDLRNTSDIDMKRYDLMQDINARGTYLLSKLALPHLRQASNAHILTLSPPINLNPRWAGMSLAYTMAKYGMSLTTLGLAEELRADGIAANSLWPRTLIATAAVQNLLGGDAAMAKSRRPEIMADAAHAILVRDSRQATGNFYIDDEVLAEEGVTDLSAYAYGDDPSALQTDIFLD
jgi:citronellol/citronellal dehydrogenase